MDGKTLNRTMPKQTRNKQKTHTHNDLNALSVNNMLLDGSIALT